MSSAVLDSEEETAYTVDGTESAVHDTECSEESRGGDDTMIVFLSFPRWTAEYRRVVTELTRRGLVVLTNFDRYGHDGAERKTDLRLARIRRSDVYINFEDVDRTSGSTIRQVEFGYALGLGLQVAYVGNPLNSLHRYGDVFDDVNDFLRGWYSSEYLDAISQWLPDGTRSAAVA